MIVPEATETKALFIIDAQPLTCDGKAPLSIMDKIARYIGKVPYDAYALVEYHAPSSSMFYKQHDFLLLEDAAGKTHAEILKALIPHEDRLIRVRKTTRSCFKSENPDGLTDFLKQKQIQEIHFAGFDVNDCVLASAYDAIDLGYYSFVLEELCHHYAGIQSLFDAALTILHRQNMSNNSLHDKIERKEIAL